jgi:hypothetical protein
MQLSSADSDISIEYTVKGQKSLTAITVATPIEIAWIVVAMEATTTLASRLCASNASGGERRSEENESRNFDGNAVELHSFC